MDLNLLRTSVGQTLNTAAHGHGSVLGLVTLPVAFAAGCLTIGRKLVLSLFEYFKGRNFPSEGILGIAVLIAFLCAAFTQWIGIHAIFGAFLAGIMIGETGEALNGTRELLRQMVFYIFSPLFLRRWDCEPISSRTSICLWWSGYSSFALIAKFIGGCIGAYLGGKQGNHAFMIGFGLIPQGAMGIILAFLALEFSLINETVFVALVCTALVTSIVSGPLLKWTLRRETRAAHAINLF
jgi:Kef-type K+ transport system membrane component KefB